MKKCCNVFLLVLLGFLISCGSQNRNDKSVHLPDNKMQPDIIKKYFDAEKGCFRDGIIGGTQVTSQNSRKNHVALLILTDAEGNKSVCTGVLLSKRLLLTAAHCADGPQLDIYFHHSSYCSQGMNKNLIYQAERTFLHPQWLGHQGIKLTEALQQANNDLALVKLAKDAPMNYQPVRIAHPQELTSATEVVQIGYGRTGTQESHPPVLREVFKKIQQVKYLDYSHYLLVDQKNSAGGCSGDSGGPLLLKSKGSYAVVGVASFLFDYQSKENACETGDLAYVSLTDYLPWLNETMNQLK